LEGGAITNCRRGEEMGSTKSVTEKIAELNSVDRKRFDAINQIIASWNFLSIGCVNLLGEYKCESWELFEIQQNGGGAKELRAYLFPYIKKHIRRQPRRLIVLWQARGIIRKLKRLKPAT